jgi:cell wall-associated NlpC family hydrolase
MARRKGRHQAPRQGVIGPALRPIAWSAALSAAVAFAFANPVYADPTLPNTVPDAGSRPAPAGTLQLPGQAPPPTTGGSTYTPPASVNGPLATQVYSARVEVQMLEQQLVTRLQEREQAKADLGTVELQLRQAKEAVAKAEAAADSAAAEALKKAAELPPGMFGSDLHGLSELSRLQRGERSSATTEEADRELARAKDAERVAQDAYNAALSRHQAAITQFTTLETTYKTKDAALAELEERNASQLAVIERAREEEEQRLGAQYLGDETIAGKAAHPKAVAAMQFAKSQLGKRYVWGTEGPDTYDCSGLMWASYRSVGYYQLPRVSRDQYYATRGKAVSKYALLPGDLIFFASGNSWTSIHHVGMYVGNGMMIHAPNSRERVKISTVWWSRFFAATRVYGEVAAPVTPPSSPNPTTPPATTPPATTPPATPKPPTTPPPTTPTPSPSTSPKPPTTPPTPPTTPPKTTPTPTPTPPETPSATPATSSAAPATSDASPDTESSASRAASEAASATASSSSGS